VCRAPLLAARCGELRQRFPPRGIVSNGSRTVPTATRHVGATSSRAYSCISDNARDWESACLILTEHCDGPSGCWHNVISAQCSECQSEEIQPSAVNGGTNYDSLKVAKS